MAQQIDYRTTPPGRIVMGDPFVAQVKDNQGVLRKTPQWFIGLAIPKTALGLAEMIAYIQAQAAATMPSTYTIEGFAWKYFDGDDPRNAGKAGMAGCMVFRFSTGWPVSVYDESNNPLPRPAAGQPAMLKCGDYADVCFLAKGNDSTQSPGIYLNQYLIRRLGFGEAIVAGPAPGDVFGVAQLPPGASSTPIGAQPMPAVGTVPVAVAQPPVVVQPVAIVTQPVVAPAPVVVQPTVAPVQYVQGTPGAPYTVAAPAPVVASQPAVGPMGPGVPGTAVAPLPGAPVAAPAPLGTVPGPIINTPPGPVPLGPDGLPLPHPSGIPF